MKKYILPFQVPYCSHLPIATLFKTKFSAYMCYFVYFYRGRCYEDVHMCAASVRTARVPAAGGSGGVFITL